MTPSAIEHMGAQHCVTPTFSFALGPMANYFPAFYVPAATGLRLAIMLGAKPLGAFVIGRLANSVAFVLIGFFALRHARRGRLLLFCGLTMPATLTLAASFNQDGLLIATAALAASLGASPKSGYRSFTAGLMFLVAAAKPPYIFLCAMMFDRLTPSPPRPVPIRMIASGSVVAAVLLWSGAMARHVVTPVDRAPYEAGALFETNKGQTFTSTNPAAQMQVFYDHPVAIAKLPLDSMFHDPWLPRQFMGIFGWLNVFLPDATYWAIEFSFFVAVISELCFRTQSGPDRRLVALYTMATVGAIWAIYVVQYLTWTNVGQLKIDGVSGRYFIPLVPMIAMGIPHVVRLNAPRLLLACEFTVIGVALLNTATTVQVLYDAYHDLASLTLYLHAV